MGCNYDIAISYQSKLEKKASRLADYLRTEGLNVFFAPAKQSEIMSEKLHQVLYDVYRNQSLIKVLMVTEEYLKGDWTSLEMRMSLDSTKEEPKRLIIINYMGENLPDNLKDFIYLDGQKMYDDEIASMIIQRIQNMRKVHMDKKGEGEKRQYTEESIMINNNGGIVTGDGATFSNLHINN